MSETLAEAWKDLNHEMDLRQTLLDQNVAFHESAAKFSERMEEATTRFSQMSVPVTAEEARQELTVHQEEKREIMECSMHTLSQGQSLLDKIKQTGLHSKSTAHATTAACYGIEKMLEKLQDRRRQLELMWSQRKSYLEQGYQLCQLDAEIKKITDWFQISANIYLSRTELGESLETAEALSSNHDVFEQEFMHTQGELLKIVRAFEQLSHTANLDVSSLRQKLQSIDDLAQDFMIRMDFRRTCIVSAVTFYRLLKQAMSDIDKLETELQAYRSSGSAIPEKLMSLTERLSLVTTPAIREGHLLLDRVGRDNTGASGLSNQLKELEGKYKSFDNKLREEIGKISQKSESYHTFRETYSFMNSWLSQIAESALRDHGVIGFDLRSARDFQSTFEQLADDLKEKEKNVISLQQMAQFLSAEGDAAASQVNSASEELSKKWNNVLGIVEMRRKISSSYVCFHKTVHTWTLVSDDIEEFLKTAPVHVTESLNKEVQNKWTTACQTANDVETKATEVASLLTQVEDDSSLKIVEASQTIKKIITQMRQKLTNLRQLFESWTEQVTINIKFRSEWESFVEESRQIVDWVLKTEHEFFPAIAGDLGDSLERTTQYNEKLLQFDIVSKEVKDKIELQVKKAQEFTLRGPVSGECDLLVNDLIKVNQRFDARIAEYKLLLSMSIKFFTDLTELEAMLSSFEQKYKSTDIPSCDRLTPSTLQEHAAERDHVLHLIDTVASAGEEIVIRVRQQNTDQVYTSHIERLLMQANLKLEAFEKAWRQKQEKLEQIIQPTDGQQRSAEVDQISKNIMSIKHQLFQLKINLSSSLPGLKMNYESAKTLLTALQQVQKSIIDLPAQSAESAKLFDKIIMDYSQLEMELVDFVKFLDASIRFYSLYDESEQWVNEATQLLSNTNSQMLNCRDGNKIVQLQKNISQFKQSRIPEQKERVSQLVNLSVQLYGPDGPQKVQQISDKVADLQMYIERSDHDLVSLYHMINQSQDVVDVSIEETVETSANYRTENMDTTEFSNQPSVSKTEETRYRTEVIVSPPKDLETGIQPQTKPKTPSPSSTKEPLQAFPPVHAEFKSTTTVEKVTQQNVIESFSPERGFTVSEAPPQAPLKTKAPFPGAIQVLPTVLPDSKTVSQVKSPPKTLPKPSNAQGAPVLLTQLQSAEINEGDRYSFNCAIESPVPFEVYWYKDGIPITSPDYEQKVFGNQASLTIEETFSEDTATYTIQATNNFGSATSSAKLVVKELRYKAVAPDFVRTLKSCDVFEGAPYALECQVTGNPTPTVSWYKENDNIDNSPEYVITKINGTCTLRSKSSRPSHSGRYTCLAVNSAGEASSTARINILPGVAPRLTAPFLDMTVESDHPVEITCHFEASPTPSIQWFRENAPIDPSSDFQIRNTNTSTTLEISLAFPEDSGTFTVVITNCLGEMRASCKLIVQNAPSTDGDFAAAGPVITQPLKPRESIEGSRVRMDCVIVGQPEPEIVWFHNQQPIKESPTVHFIFEGDRCSLIMDRVQQTDRGIYKVLARNTYGEAVSECTLHVEGISEQSDASIQEDHSGRHLVSRVPQPQQQQVIDGTTQPTGAPHLVQAFHDTRVKQGDSVTLTCVITGTPKPKVKWFVGGEPIVSPDYQINNSGDVYSLHIKEVFDEDAGRFTIVAENPHGKASCSAVLHVDLDDVDSGPSNTISTTQVHETRTVSFGGQVTTEEHHTKKTIVGGKTSEEEQHSSSTYQIPSNYPQTSGYIPDQTTPQQAVVQERPTVPAIPASAAQQTTRKILTTTTTVEQTAPKYTPIQQTQQPILTRTEQTEVQQVRTKQPTSTSQQILVQTSQQVPAQTHQQVPVQIAPQVPVQTPQHQPATFIKQVHQPRQPAPVRQPVPRYESPSPQRLAFDAPQRPLMRYPSEPLLNQSYTQTQKTEQLFYMNASPQRPKPVQIDVQLGGATETVTELKRPSHFRPRVEAPNIITRLTPVTVKEGEAITLMVTITGTNPVVTWYREGAEITDIYRKDFTIRKDGHNHYLIIHKACLEDTGLFAVKAENENGFAACDCNVTVISVLPIQQTLLKLSGFLQDSLPKEPEVQKSKTTTSQDNYLRCLMLTPLPHTRQVYEGERIEIKIRLDVNPEPIIKWYKDGVELKPSHRITIDYYGGVACLTYNAVIGSDSGHYLVHVVNAKGSVTSEMDFTVLPGQHPIDQPDVSDIIHQTQSTQSSSSTVRLQTQSCTSMYLPNTDRQPLQAVWGPRQMSEPPARFPQPQTWIPKQQTTTRTETRETRVQQSPTPAGWKTSHVELDISQSPSALSPRTESLFSESRTSVMTPISWQTPTPVSKPVQKPAETAGWPDQVNQGQRSSVSQINLSLTQTSTPTQIGYMPQWQQVQMAPPASGWQQTSTWVSTSVQPPQIPAGPWQPVSAIPVSPQQTFHIRTPSQSPARPPSLRAQSASPIRTPTSPATRPMSSPQRPAQTVSRPQPGPTVKPKFSRPLGKQPFREGETVSVECLFLGYPAPQVTWSRGGIPLSDNDRYSIMTTEGTGHSVLYIKNVRPEDSGEYTCTVRNEGGDVSSTAYLIPEADYQKMLASEAQRQRELFEKSQQQSFVSDLQTTIHQRQRTVSQSPSRQRVPSYSSPSTASAPVTQPYPQYRPVQTQHQQISMTTITQHITPEPQISIDMDIPRRSRIHSHAEDDDLDTEYKGEVMPPLIVQQLKDFKLSEGQDATFYCKVAGVPRPKVTWFKNGERLKASSRITMKFSADGYHTLRIRDTNISDEGIYLIHAVNAGGTTTSIAQLYIDSVKNIDTASHVSSHTLSMLQNREQIRERKKDSIDSGIVEKVFRPVFKSIPQDQTVREGTCVRLDCVISAKPSAEVLWYRNGQIVTEDQLHKIVVNENGIHSLIIRSCSLPDSGQYTCTGSNKAGHAQFTVNLTVLEKEQQIPPKFTERISGANVVSGQDIVLTCAVTGNPTPHLSWTKDNRFIESNQKYSVVTKDGRTQLTIHNADVNDAGWYQCSAVSVAGSSTSRAKVTVEPVSLPKQDVPQIIIPRRVTKILPTPEEVTESTDIQAAQLHRSQLRCNIGEPLELTVDQSQLSPIKSQHSVTSHREEQTFKVLPKEEEEELDVEYYSKDKPIAPYFTKHPTKATIKEGHPVRFECTLLPIGDPSMTVEWYFNGQLVKYGHRFIIRHDWSYVSLDILYCFPEDSGEYVCVAKNKIGSAQTTPAILNVKARRAVILDTQFPVSTEGVHQLQELESHWNEISLLDIEDIMDAPKEACAPCIDVKPQPVEVLEGGCAKFIAKVSGYPRPKITWTINNTVVVTSSRFYTHYDGHCYLLEIPKVREYDNGTVTIHAVNGLGEDQATTQLIVHPNEDFRLKLHHSEESVPSYETQRRTLVQLRTAKPNIETVTTQKIERVIEQQTLEVRQPETKPLQTQLKRVEKPVAAPEPIPQKPAEPKQAKPVEIKSLEKADAEKKPERKVPQESPKPVPAVPADKPTEIPAEEKPKEKPKPQPKPKQPIAQPPQFTKPLSPVKVTEGQPVTLEVAFEGFPPPQITWYRESFEIRPSNDFQIKHEAEKSSLYMPEVFLEDQGMYMVKAYNPYGMMQTKAMLAVLPDENKVKENLPTFISKLSPITATAGEPVSLSVQLQEEPTPTYKVEWFKNTKRLDISPRYKFISERHIVTLLIYEVTMEDSGLYEVRVSNSAGTSTSNAPLTVKEPEKPRAPSPPAVQPPQLVQPLVPGSVEEGQSTTLTCSITGSPVVTWFHNGQVIKQSKYFDMKSSDDVHTLTIAEAFPEDQGEYLVTAKNSSGEVVTSASLNVIPLPTKQTEVPKETGEPPRFVQPITSIDSVEGQKVVFETVITGSPQPEVKWFRENEEITSSLDFQITSEDGTHRLIIPEVFPEDSGLFMCKAQNPFGIAESTAELYVEVPHPETKEAKPPAFDKPLPPATAVTHGEDAVLSVMVDAYPPAKHTWYFNGREIRTSQKYIITEEIRRVTLTIKSVQPEDSGEYTVKMDNEYGDTTCTTILNVLPSKLDEDVADSTQTDLLNATETFSAAVEIPILFTKQLDSEMFAKPREQALFEVELDKKPETVEWFVNKMLIKPTSKYEIKLDENRAQLLVNNLTPADSGVYTVQVTFGGVKVASSSQLFIQEDLPQERPDIEGALPSFVEKLEDVEVLDGSELTMQVKVAGNPVPELSWYLDDENIDDKEDLVITYDRQTGYCKLIFVDIMPEDAGVYSCVASNPFGEVSTSCFLSVRPVVSTQEVKPIQQAPAITPEDLQTMQESVTIQKTEEHITTLQDTQPGLVTVSVETSEVPVPIASDVVDVVMQQKQTKIKSDAGEEKIIIEFTENLEQFSPPRIVQPLQPVAVYEEQEAVFSCSIVGEPIPEIRWYIDGKELAQTDRVTMTYENGVCTLKINHVTSQDEAVYQVEAVNKVGKATISANLIIIPEGAVIESTTTTVTRKQQEYLISGNQIVTDAEVFEKTLKFLQPLPSHVETELEADVVMSCQVEAIPKATLTWYKNGVSLEAQPRYTIKTDQESGETQLEISKITEGDLGTYQVVAENEAGRISSSCVVTLKQITKKKTTVEKTITEIVGGKTVVKKITQTISDDTTETLETIVTTEAPEEQVTTLHEQLIPPTFIYPLTNISVHDGEDVRFVCELNHDVSPMPSTKWYKDEVEIEITKHVQICFDEKRFLCTLEITDCFPENQGLYTCRAVNDAGFSETSAYLEIKQFEYESITDEEESVASRDEVTATGAGDEIDKPQAKDVVSVEVEKPLVDEATWYVDDKKVDEEYFEILEEKGVYSLKLPEIIPEDEGTYTLVAQNELGSVTTSSTLSVATKTTDSQEDEESEAQEVKQEVPKEEKRRQGLALIEILSFGFLAFSSIF